MPEIKQKKRPNNLICFFLPALLLLIAMVLSFSTWRDENNPEYSYNDKGFLVRKVFRNEIEELDYDEKCNKINQVKRRERRLFSRPGITRYEYNNQCYLAKAIDSQGDIVLLDYDELENISHIEIKGEPSIKLFYDESGRAKGIAVQEEAPVAIIFDKDGEMTGLMGLDLDMIPVITNTLKKLLNIVSQARVDLKS